ncbi:hypothetical protein CGJ08_14915 [Vibrio parahaemolyticus]|uniref:hypothetical protein n=1 Tax=Vibrio parahaemolyticus TaxID=670 RepID=UPI00111D656F|nr:hypothetical protein [Vibrio parahaemolyticus]TOG11938.1 hypothetical protein CGJ08_14915 [Vibrio parahaemolyticus]TOP34931.1 hypothetical protein CGH19_03070 [Vibrio parahaemolyticus]
MFHNVLIITVLLLVTACTSSVDPETQCTVAPLAKQEKNKTAAVEMAADLSKWAAAPITANASATIESTVNATFQNLPDDEVAACAMLLQTYVCINDRARASEFQQYLSSRTSCK